MTRGSDVSDNVAAETVDLRWKPRFYRFWWSQSLSQLAAQIAAAAIPLIALASLAVPSAAVGLISFVEYLPVLMFTLLLGPLIDGRTKSRPILLGHFGRAAAFGALALLVAAHSLSFPVLLAVVFVIGGLTAAFDVAVQALVPSVVPRARLVFANSRIQLSYSLAQVLGPSLGGIAASLDAPQLAFGAIALGYAVAGFIFWAGAVEEAQPEAVTRPGSIVARITEGLSFCLKDPVLKILLAAGALFNLLEQALIATFLVHGSRTLAIPVHVLGFDLAASGLGAVCAAAFAARLKRHKRANTMALWMCIATLSPLALLLVSGPSVRDQVLMATVFFTYGAGLVVYNILAVSLRQSRAPADMLARVGSVYRFFAYGALALGGLLSAFLVGAFGSAAALHAIILCMACAAVLYAVRILRVRDEIDVS